MAVNLFDELIGIVRALDRGGVAYALCGGLAVAVHGHPRATRDVDLVVSVDDVERIRDLVRPLGFSLPALPMTFEAGKREQSRLFRISKIVDGDPLTLDLLTGSVYDRVLETRVTMEHRGVRLSVVSREGLRTMKRLAGRPQDIADLLALGLADE